MSPRTKTYVLDTNVLSALAHQRPIPAVAEWIRDVDGELAVPIAAVIEIQRGISYLLPRRPQRAKELQTWLEGLLSSDVLVLPLDVKIARLYAEMTTVPGLRNLWVSPPGARNPKLGQDLSVAATAIVMSAVVATMNVKDFLVIHRLHPLPGLFDPVNGKWHVPMEHHMQGKPN